MTTSQKARRRQDNAARQEIRRLVSDRRPPSNVEPAAFGPWAATVTALRARIVEKGPDACRALFLEQVKEQPGLNILVSGEAEREDRKTSWTWAELRKTGFPDPVWVVPDVIPSGLVTIGGRPKIGKSWLALQIACAVGTGGQVFDRPVSKGKVLYLALEDSPRRLKLRAEKQLWPAEVDVTFETEWPALGHGGTPALRKRIEDEGYTLVIVDTLTRALGSVDQMDLAETALTIGDLQRLSQELDVTVLLMDHHRKPNGLNPDPVDDLFGSTGKAQPLDGICGLYRERGKQEALLRVTGRDVEEAVLALAFDGLTCTWTPAGESGGPKRDGAQARVLAVVHSLVAAGELAYASRIAEMVGRDRSNVGRAIGQLLRDGLIREGPRQGNLIPLLPAGEKVLEVAHHGPQPQQPLPAGEPRSDGQEPQPRGEAGGEQDEAEEAVPVTQAPEVEHHGPQPQQPGAGSGGPAAAAARGRDPAGERRSARRRGRGR